MTGLIRINQILLMLILQTTGKVIEILSFKTANLKHDGKHRQLTGRFEVVILRPGDSVQNLETPGLSGRVDSPEERTLKG